LESRDYESGTVLFLEQPEPNAINISRTAEFGF
jgi:hypothetical protein